jgi:hypothetical protein
MPGHNERGDIVVALMVSHSCNKNVIIDQIFAKLTPFFDEVHHQKSEPTAASIPKHEEFNKNARATRVDPHTYTRSNLVSEHMVTLCSGMRAKHIGPNEMRQHGQEGDEVLVARNDRMLIRAFPTRRSS